ncbi:MXAN_6577-like cysteine-rich protein [Hyalangium sp.]|uniref:MXAN_6577-like cysteine-rich protein n=1 Tax=Hyalangium sp. TaxID=2028555 RepID=UPI002D3A7CA7|nr:MXAN_6577-like cysteine-rich protein [Hyalangium sp.]HYH95961.1 MXAN_6577-like cysteine-rich protein [Hyalangium sp.]
MSSTQTRLERSAPTGVTVMVAALGLFLGGCPELGAECGEGLTTCFGQCVDISSTSANCGACGVVCGRGQVCAEGTCRCQEGSSVCAGQCAITASDPNNCGACGIICGQGRVCESGQCKVSCSQEFTRCGDRCVDLKKDSGHCGACEAACGDAKSCHSGVCTYDVVAACFNTGQVVGIQAGSDLKGPNRPLGEHPLSAAPMQDVLLVLDTAKKVREARLVDYAALPGEAATDEAPNQVLVDDPYVYVLNSSSNTLLVLQRKKEPGTLTEGTRFPQGLGLEPVAKVEFGASTNPFGMVKVGTDLWVTLYGNFFGDLSAGGKLARVNLANPSQPQLATPHIELPSGDALLPFPGSNPIPTPSGIVAQRGYLYTALNNLDPNTFSPGGPGLLARIHPQTREVKYFSLGEGCLNAGWLAPVGNRLVVSCAGKSTYDASFNLVGVEKTALVLVDEQDAVVSTWTLACPEASTSCALPSAGRFAVVGTRVYLGDNNAGRIFVVDVTSTGLTEVRGLDPQKQPPIPACQRESGFSLVGDVIAIP